MEKLKKTTVQLAKYTLAAGIGLAVDFGTLIILTELFHLHYLVGVTAGFVAGLSVIYVLSNRYVFGELKVSLRKAFVLYAVIGFVGLGILELLMWALTDGLGINYLISKALATVVVFLWNFFARRTLYHDQVPA